MSRRSLALLLLKCFGVYLLLGGLSGLDYTLQTVIRFGADDQYGRTWFYGEAVLSLLRIGLGLLFLVNTDLILRLLLRETEDSADLPATPFAYQAIGFSIVGAWALATAIPALGSRLALIVALGQRTSPKDLNLWWSENWPDVLYVVLQTLVGLALFFGSRRIAAIWFRLRPIRSAKDHGDPSAR